MSYGLLCIGNNSQTIIDSDHGVLHVMAFGRYTAVLTPQPVGSAMVATVVYSSPIVTTVPPVVFVSPDGSAQYGNFQHQGSPGNWTGFTSYVLEGPDGSTGYSPSGSYSATGLRPQKQGGYGLQVFDSDSTVVFDSNYRVMNFVLGWQKWTNTSFVNTGTVTRLWMYKASWAGGNSYIMISSFGNLFVAEDGSLGGQITIGFVDAARSAIQITVIGNKKAAPVIELPLLAATLS